MYSDLPTSIAKVDDRLIANDNNNLLNQLK